MKIYKSKHGTFYFGQNQKNGWFSFHSQPPEIDDLKLCPSSFRYDEERLAWEDGVGVDVPEEIERSVFNKLVNNPKDNYQAVCEFIKKYYPETTQEELDMDFQHHPNLVELVNSVIEEDDNWDRTDSWHYSELYRSAKHLMGMWDNDAERVKKYIREHEIWKFRSFDDAMVDIFGECHPTKRNLLHDFHNHWGKELYHVIDKAIEVYPDEKDFDKAFYYVRDNIKKT